MTFHVPEACRITLTNLPRADLARLVSNRARDGNNGAFFIEHRTGALFCVASDERYWAKGGLKGMAWEHVSVQAHNRVPTWAEMCAIKALFWDADDCVVQFHPPQHDYVNCHPYVLHLWRPVGVELPRPDPMSVGPRST